MAEFVAVSVIRHGNEDGTVTELQPGESLKKGTFGQKTLEDLYASGSITLKGASDDPNTWEGSFVAGQTPATIEANLRSLARALDGPGSPESTVDGGLHPNALLDPGHKDSTARGVELDDESKSASVSNPASVLVPPDDSEQGGAEEPATTPATPTGTTSPSKEAQTDAKASKS